MLFCMLPIDTAVQYVVQYVDTYMMCMKIVVAPVCCCFDYIATSSLHFHNSVTSSGFDAP